MPTNQTTLNLKPMYSAKMRADKRRCERRPLSVRIIGQSMTAGSTPVGDPLELVTVDLSDSGVGFMSAQRIRFRRILLEFPNEDPLLAEIVWEQATGTGPFNRYGAKFVDGDHPMDLG